MEVAPWDGLVRMARHSKVSQSCAFCFGTWKYFQKFEWKGGQGVSIMLGEGTSFLPVEATAEANIL